jgi:Fur family ferric uptake transcriptional regulator
MDTKKILERFGYYLKQRGLSLTRERRQTVELIGRVKSPFSVDDLDVAARKSGRKISRATLYRTIQLLLESRILREAALGERQSSYEISEPGFFQGRMICQHCGTLTEFKGPELEKFIHAASVAQGFLALTAQITFSGVCRACADANPQSLRRQVCVPFLRYAQSRET